MTREKEKSGLAEGVGPEHSRRMDYEAIGELKSICNAVGNDLSSLRALMDDAVGNLMQTFENIAQAARERNNVSLTQTDRFVSTLAEQAERAVVFLQFHDTAAQMMDNLEQRARVVETGTDHLLKGNVKAAVLAFGQTAQIRERNPRNANASATGDIDLF